ncbi:hypothetical protein ACPV5L_01835 [Vibrio astriarenae]
MLHLTCAIAAVATTLHHKLTPKEEHNEKTHRLQTLIRIFTWFVFLVFVSFEGTNQALTVALQLSLLTTIAHDLSELCWHNALSKLACLVLAILSVVFRAGGMWFIVARDPTYELELVYIATVTSIIVLTWLLVTPTIDKKPKLPLFLFSFATLIQTWLAIEVVIHEDNSWYLLLIGASALYIYSFCRFYVFNYYRKNRQHLSCIPSSLIIANLFMVVTASLSV